jgi:hypothetical protein
MFVPTNFRSKIPSGFRQTTSEFLVWVFQLSKVEKRSI